VEGIIADTGEDISHSSYLPRVWFNKRLCS
jgi:hypothetical protein